MDQLEQFRQVIDRIVQKNPDPEESRCGFVHLYGVSATCTLLAIRRGLDPEQCSAAGMLHDIWNYQYGDSREHDRLGAGEARKILTSLGTYSPEEIDRICEAILTYGDKQSVQGEMAELLKDADLFQHYLYHPQIFEANYAKASREKNPSIPMRIQRLQQMLIDLGIRASDA